MLGELDTLILFYYQKSSIIGTQLALLTVSPEQANLPWEVVPQTLKLNVPVFGRRLLPSSILAFLRVRAEAMYIS